MKNLLIIAFFCSISLGISGTTKLDYKINITRMIPAQYNSRDVSYGFFINLHNDSVSLYLPYIGVAYQSNYGNSDGLDFSSSIENLKYKTNKKGHTILNFRTRNNLYYYNFSIEIYKNGTINIFLSTNHQQNISYEGYIDYKN